ncbi:MAG: hypothetical protein A2651_00515 [Candidatus Yanofskybacteria bacterium RIFCSPHIGHO2_01_FULL_42_12]|uniref:Uncharacterized protein n=1 Tax=Candidatus Yanofskybacteria bacterium RIFCSPLOWO2_01_FULL_42_49 TaxID=1802694 RepID=A0A1F8GCN9_9BACT|nr:MAG: hypothetical protein A2651_00515 [Candidatus Yanofskybacteria bacterium RIFCSPHIGHO2_01_FULL_42_12]OGN22516.1 MAG: hypothetical protein A2918_02015 [Candidatus Yanofskybacteria bacterium RIFCSPLOWO2_01_FULL_42_49]
MIAPVCRQADQTELGLLNTGPKTPKGVFGLSYKNSDRHGYETNWYEVFGIKLMHNVADTQLKKFKFYASFGEE